MVGHQAQNERVETGGQNGRNVNVERRMGECFQWKANGQRSKGLVNEHNHPFLLLKRKKALFISRSTRSESFWIEMPKTV